jgi:hypothetical protein
VYLAPGEHEISATAEGRAAVTQSISASAGERRTVELIFVEEPEQPTPRPGGRATLEIFCSAPRVDVVVDGLPAGQVPLDRTLEVTAGRHRIVFMRPSLPPIRRDVEVRAGTTARVDCGVSAIGSTPSPAAEARSSATLGYVMGGVGIGLGVAAAAHYFWNKGRYDDWRSAHRKLQGDRDALDYREKQLANNALADSIASASRATVGLGVASGVLLASGGVLVIVKWPVDVGAAPKVQATLSYQSRW